MLFSCPRKAGLLIIAFIDISREVAAEQAARALERRYRSIFDSLFSFMVVLDLEGRVLDESRA